MRLLRFNAANGGISLVGTVILMRLLVEQLHLPILVANGAAILTCSIVNFGVGDRFVFRGLVTFGRNTGTNGHALGTSR